MSEQASTPRDPVAAGRTDGASGPPALRPLIEGLQIIATGAAVCGPDDPFCELPAPATSPVESTPVASATDPRAEAR